MDAAHFWQEEHEINPDSKLFKHVKEKRNELLGESINSQAIM